MKKANGPKKKKKLITHLMSMPQAAGKNPPKITIDVNDVF